MRTLFWFLLLGNVILFAVMQQGGVSWGEPPYQVQPPLNEDKIRLLPASQNSASRNAALQNAASQNAAPQNAASPNVAPNNLVTQKSAPQDSVTRSPATTVTVVEAPAENPRSAPPQTTDSKQPAPSVSAAAVNPVSPTAPPAEPVSPANKAAKPAASGKPAPSVCLEWGDFSGADLKRATDFLSTLQLGEKVSQRQVQYDKGYWVYIPPLKSKAAANRKVTQLKKLGIKEYFIVQDAGAFRYAISLGVFKTQEAARNYLGELKAKGLSAAKVGERASKLKTTMFLLNGTDKSVAAKLAAAKKDFPGSELKNVPCALTK